MRAVYVPLRADVKDALLTLAEREARDPRRQAARLLEEGLRGAGVLTDPKIEGHFARPPRRRPKMPTQQRSQQVNSEDPTRCPEKAGGAFEECRHAKSSH